MVLVLVNSGRFLDINETSVKKNSYAKLQLIFPEINQSISVRVILSQLEQYLHIIKIGQFFDG